MVLKVYAVYATEIDCPDRLVKTLGTEALWDEFQSRSLSLEYAGT